MYLTGAALAPPQCVLRTLSSPHIAFSAMVTSLNTQPGPLPSASGVTSLVLCSRSGHRLFKVKGGHAQGAVEYTHSCLSWMGSWCPLTRKAVLRHSARQAPFPGFPLHMPGRGYPRGGLAGRAGGIFASVFRAGNPRVCGMKICFIPKHRAMLVSKFTPQQMFCVGSQGWGLPGCLTSGFQVAFADADQLSAGGGEVWGGRKGCSLKGLAAKIWQLVLKQCPTSEEKEVFHKAVVLKVRYPSQRLWLPLGMCKKCTFSGPTQAP